MFQGLSCGPQGAVAKIILVGDEPSIRTELSKHVHSGVDLEIVHTTQIAGMAEKPIRHPAPQKG